MMLGRTTRSEGAGRMDTRRFTVRVDETTYGLLEAAAGAQHLRPAELARQYIEAGVTDAAHQETRGSLEAMIRSATRDASAHHAAGQRSLLARQAIANATSMFLQLEVLAQAFDWSPEESQRFYNTCRNKAVSFVQNRENTPSEQDG